MKNIKIFILAATSFFLLSFSLKEDCSILKNSNFTYKTGGKEVFVTFKGEKHVEYHNKRKHFIKSDIEWVSDCEYYLTIEEITIPNFPFDPGTRLHIKVDRVSGKNVYYTSTLRGRSWEGKLKKTKKSK